MCRRLFQVLPPPLTRASHPSHCLNFFWRLCSRGFPCDLPLLVQVLFLLDEVDGIEPPMLPPYGGTSHASAFYPLAMPQYLFTFACRVVDTLANGVDNGHGKGPWDDITGVVKQAVVDTPSCLCRHCERIRANSSSRRLYGWASMGGHHRSMPMVEYASEIQSEYWSTG